MTYKFKLIQDGETVATATTDRNITKEELLNFAGAEPVPQNYDDDPDYILNGVEIWVNDCDLVLESEADEIAEKIRSADVWNPDDVKKLCDLAGLEREYLAADGDTVESVIFKAAEILNVEII